MHKILEYNCQDYSSYLHPVQLPGIQSIHRPGHVRGGVDCQRRPLCSSIWISVSLIYKPVWWKCDVWSCLWNATCCGGIIGSLKGDLDDTLIRWQKCLPNGWVEFSAQNRSCILCSEHEMQELVQNQGGKARDMKWDSKKIVNPWDQNRWRSIQKCEQFVVTETGDAGDT